YDYVLLDGEDGVLDGGNLAHLLRAAAGAGIAAVVRVPGDDPKRILQALDLGADGVMAPQIEDGEQAARVGRACRYPPVGTRGLFPGTRASAWGTRAVAEHVRQQDEGVLCLVQIETPAGVDAADEIAGASRVDGVVF